MKCIYGKLFCIFISLADGLFGQSVGMAERIMNLPVLDRSGIKVGYEGSIDKKERMRIGTGLSIKRMRMSG